MIAKLTTETIEVIVGIVEIIGEKIRRTRIAGIRRKKESIVTFHLES